MGNFKELFDAGYRPHSGHDPQVTPWPVECRWNNGWADKVGFTMRLVNAEGNEKLCAIESEEELQEVFKLRASVDQEWAVELAERQKSYSFKRPGAMDPRIVLDDLASLLAYGVNQGTDLESRIDYIRQVMRESGYPVGNDPNITERREVNYMPPEYEQQRAAARMR